MPKLINLLKLTVAAFFIAVSAFGKPFTLTGKITGAPENYYAIITYTNSKGETLKANCLLKRGGEFKISGNIEEPVLAYLNVQKSINDEDIINRTDFFLEPGLLTVKGDYGALKNISIKGSASENDYLLFKRQYDVYLKNGGDSLQSEYLKLKSETENNQDTGDKGNALNKKYEDIQDKIQTQRQKIIYQFITAHPNSYVSAYELDYNMSRLPFNTVKKLYGNLNTSVRNSFYGKETQSFIAGIEDNSVGKIAKKFKAVDVNGKQINLADFKGKAVLLDFWASWCIPCRESTPHLVQLFNRYKKSGFEVIAIAEDDFAPNVWKKAIQKDGTNIWHNILRGEKSKNDINDKYNVHSLPTRILIGKDGTIIGRYTGTDEATALDSKLAAIFK